MKYIVDCRGGGSNAGFSMVSPTKVEAWKFFVFNLPTYFKNMHKYAFVSKSLKVKYVIQ